MIQRRYYNLEKLAAPPKPLTPREEAELRQQQQQAARREQEVRSGTDDLGLYRRRQALERLWDEQTKYNPNMKGRDDLKAQYIDSYMNNPGQMSNDQIAKETDQARKKNYADGHLEHAYLDGDWAPENTSRAMQLFGASKMNDKGELEDVPLGYDIYGKPITDLKEQAAQYAMRPLDAATKFFTSIPGQYKEMKSGVKGVFARSRDAEEYREAVRTGRIPKPEGWDENEPWNNTQFEDDPDFQKNRLENLKGEADEYMEDQEDAHAFTMARQKRRIEEETGNKGHEAEQQEADEYFKDGRRSVKQKYLIPLLERGGDNAVRSAKAIGIDDLNKLEKKHPWLAKARGLTGPALKTFLAVAAATNPELGLPVAEIAALYETGDAAVSTLQAVGKAGKSQQAEIDKNQGKKPGELTGNPGGATNSGFLDAISNIPNVKRKPDGTPDIKNIDKYLAEVGGSDNVLGKVNDVTKNLAKNVGELAGQQFADATDKQIATEIGKGATSTLLAGTGNALGVASKPTKTTSKVLKPQKADPTQMTPQQRYVAELERVRQNHYAKLEQQQQQQVQSMPDEQPMQSEEPNYGYQMDSTFDVPYSRPTQGNQLYSQEPAAPMQQQQAVNPQVPKQPQAVNQQVPKQPQAVTPQVPKQPQAVNTQVPQQPQAAKVNITPPKQGTQVASVTPATKGYKIQ